MNDHTKNHIGGSSPGRRPGPRRAGVLATAAAAQACRALVPGASRSS